MEAVREATAAYIGEEEALQLPPAPTAFPVELLQEFESQEDFGQHEAGAQTTISNPGFDVSAVRASCLSALSVLVHDPVVADDSSSRAAQVGPERSQLVAALEELLDVCDELQSAPSISMGMGASSSTPVGYQRLVDQLLELRTSIDRAKSTASTDRANVNNVSSLHPTVVKVRETLNLTRLETLCGIVTTLCEERLQAARKDLGIGMIPTDDPPVYFSTKMPLPQPSFSGDGTVESEHHSESLPSYVDERMHSTVDTKRERQEKAPSVERDRVLDTVSNEKMLLELDAVTSAIERLYEAAPQLANQRADYRTSRAEPSDKGKGRKKEQSFAEERVKEQELLTIWERIEKAHGNGRATTSVQSVEVEPGWEKRLQQERKRSFMTDLLDHSESGRMHGQDSELLGTELAKARELRRRDLFLRELLNQSALGRMNGQDATPSRTRSLEGLKDCKDSNQDQMLGDIAMSSSSGHLATQDGSFSAEPVIYHDREQLTGDIVAFGRRGRMESQDSTPSSLRTNGDLHHTFEQVLANPAAGPAMAARDLSDVANVYDNSSRSRSGSISNKSSSSLRKVASFVRRGSTSKQGTAGQPDMQTLSYVAEHQENLQVVQVLLSTPQPVDWTSITAETEVSSTAGPLGEARVVLKSSLGGSAISLDLPTAVLPWQRISLKELPTPTEFKLSAGRALSAPTSALNMVITHALSAPELRKMQPTALACTSCDRELADLSTISLPGRWEAGAGFKDLPSEHWAEMLEAWMCHADAGFTNQLTQRTKDGFWPIAGTVLVGGSYILVDESDACLQNLKIDGKTSPDMWRIVSCLCGEVVGRQNSKNATHSSSTIRFAKHSIAVLRLNHAGEEVQSLRFPLSVFIVSDMLELAQAHASYRFSITQEDDADRRIFIWLFNPSIGVSYRKGSEDIGTTQLSSKRSSSSASSTRSRRSSVASSLNTARQPAEAKSMKAVKVLYRIMRTAELENELTPGDPIMAGFKSGQSTEHLTYPKAVCDGLEDILRHSTSVYPAARRMMGAFSIGFMERV